MEKIRHQLELLRSGPMIGGCSDDRSVIAEIEASGEARANLGEAGGPDVPLCGNEV
jgi:hypothetical protein